MRLVLYRRRGCAACDRALEALRSIAAVNGLAWQARSVEGAAELEARYGARVPVVVLERGAETVELAALQVNAAALARRLRAALSGAPHPD